jgi:CHASE2 domain-containing sensor protein
VRAIRAARQGRVIPALLLGVAVSLAVIGLSRVGVFSGWQTRAVDAFQFMRDRQAPAELVLVHIDYKIALPLGLRQTPITF